LVPAGPHGEGLNTDQTARPAVRILARNWARCARFNLQHAAVLTAIKYCGSNRSMPVFARYGK